MHWATFLGSLAWSYGAPAACCALFLATDPPLIIAAIFGAFVSLGPAFATSIVFLIVVSANGGNAGYYDETVHSAAENGKGWVAVANVLAQEGCRVMAAYALIAADNHFRHNNQVLLKSRFRIVPLAAALGLGMGGFTSLLSFGTLLSAVADVTKVGSTAALYDMDACPQMPLVFAHSISALASIVSQVSWSVAVTVAVASWRAYESELPRATAFPRTAAVVVPCVVAVHLVASCVALVESRAFDTSTAEPVAGRGCAVSVPVQGAVALISAVGAAIVAVRELVPRAI